MSIGTFISTENVEEPQKSALLLLLSSLTGLVVLLSLLPSDESLGYCLPSLPGLISTWGCARGESFETRLPPEPSQRFQPKLTQCHDLSFSRRIGWRRHGDVRAQAPDYGFCAERGAA